MRPEIVVVDEPTDADREAVAAPLIAFNEAAIGLQPAENVAILLKDGDGRSLGGLWGRTVAGWLYVDLLAVPEAWRGRDLGTALMAEAEGIARRRGCRGIWLNTMAFQAPGFYEKLGFTVFGVLENNPVGSRRFFMSKVL